MEWAQRMRLRRFADPIVIQLYSEVLQKFRLAAQGKRPGRQPPAHLRERIERYFDPLPFYYAAARDAGDRPRDAIRCARSRSGRWRCTTRGTRRTRGCARSTRTTICSSTRDRARAAGIADGDWMWVESHGARCAACAATPRRSSRAPCGPGTRSARRRAHGASRPTRTKSQRGFLLNHLISDELPDAGGGSASRTPTRSPARPAGTTCACASITAGADEPHETWPQFAPRMPGACRARRRARRRWQAVSLGAGNGATAQRDEP